MYQSLNCQLCSRKLMEESSTFFVVCTEDWALFSGLIPWLAQGNSENHRPCTVLTVYKWSNEQTGRWECWRLDLMQVEKGMPARQMVNQILSSRTHLILWNRFSLSEDIYCLLHRVLCNKMKTYLYCFY